MTTSPRSTFPAPLGASVRASVLGAGSMTNHTYRISAHGRETVVVGDHELMWRMPDLPVSVIQHLSAHGGKVRHELTAVTVERI